MVHLGFLKDNRAAVVALLQAQGLTAVAADEKYALFCRAADLLVQKGHAEAEECQCYWVPGRIEVVGKHTDYAGGRSLLCAISKGFACVKVGGDGNDQDKVDLTTEFDGKVHHASLAVDPELEPLKDHWSNYPATVIRRLARNFGIKRGCGISIQCDLPGSSGMSSSSAMICAMWMILADVNGIRDTEAFQQHLATDEELYSYLGFIENGQVRV
jgi:galactokinase